MINFNRLFLFCVFNQEHKGGGMLYASSHIRRPYRHYFPIKYKVFNICFIVFFAATRQKILVRLLRLSYKILQNRHHNLTFYTLCACKRKCSSLSRISFNSFHYMLLIVFVQFAKPKQAPPPINKKMNKNTRLGSSFIILIMYEKKHMYSLIEIVFFRLNITFLCKILRMII
ncbi:hypothetical protein AGLY_001102 [Aphis glycines]|uniref:Uncharacterized protein n=1 Tax=Aphis glycines TaxID=307491 RepID=A0A6G0UAC1_APHGL|nr:hypothetical protein AGLY_001102 [Aphis glycines]